jgi:hypothetical protein
MEPLFGHQLIQSLSLDDLNLFGFGQQIGRQEIGKALLQGGECSVSCGIIKWQDEQG